MRRQAPPPAVIAGRFHDQLAGDVIAIAFAALDGVRGRKSLPGEVEQQPGQQARLAHPRSIPSVLAIASKPFLDCIPGRLVDQRLVLAFVELSFVGNPANVDRVGEELVDVPARERLATLREALCNTALGHEAEPVGRLLHSAYTAEFEIELE